MCVHSLIKCVGVLVCVLRIPNLNCWLEQPQGAFPSNDVLLPKHSASVCTHNSPIKCGQKYGPVAIKHVAMNQVVSVEHTKMVERLVEEMPWRYGHCKHTLEWTSTHCAATSMPPALQTPPTPPASRAVWESVRCSDMEARSNEARDWTLYLSGRNGGHVTAIPVNWNSRTCASSYTSNLLHPLTKVTPALLISHNKNVSLTPTLKTTWNKICTMLYLYNTISHLIWLISMQMYDWHPIPSR